MAIKTIATKKYKMRARDTGQNGEWVADNWYPRGQQRPVPPLVIPICIALKLVLVNRKPAFVTEMGKVAPHAPIDTRAKCIANRRHKDGHTNRRRLGRQYCCQHDLR